MDVPCSTHWRASTPLRSRIHSSLVSMMVASMSLVMRTGGMFEPLPAMTERVTGWALREWRHPYDAASFDSIPEGEGSRGAEAREELLGEALHLGMRQGPQGERARFPGLAEVRVSDGGVVARARLL